MCARIASDTEDIIEKFQATWREAAYEEAEMQGLMGDFYTKFEKIYSAELESERQILTHAKETVTKTIGQLRELYALLGRGCATMASLSATMSRTSSLPRRR